MNIIFTRYPSLIGGAEIGSLELCAWLSKQGHNTWFHYTEREHASVDVFINRANLFGVRLIRDNTPGLSDIYDKAAVAIMYCHNFTPDHIATQINKVPLRIAMHGGFLEHYINTTGKVIPHMLWSVSDDLKNWAMANNSMWKAERIFAAEFPMDTDFWKKSSGINTLSNKRKNGGKPIIGNMGRPQDFKRLHIVAGIARKLGLECLFCGESEGIGDDRPVLKSVFNNITIYGAVADTRTVLEKLSVFLLPSLAEGFPRALAEAMMLECPIISTNVGGIPDSGIEDKYLFDKYNINGMLNATKRLVDSPSLRKEVGKYNRAKCMERSNHISERINTFFHSIQTGNIHV